MNLAVASGPRSGFQPWICLCRGHRGQPDDRQAARRARCSACRSASALVSVLHAHTGLAGGHTVQKRIEKFDHWIAAGLLLFVAAKMIKEALEKKRDGSAADSCLDMTRGHRLLMLSLATSLDALAVGLGLAALNVPIVYPSVVIGLVAFLLTAAGTSWGPFSGAGRGNGPRSPEASSCSSSRQDSHRPSRAKKPREKGRRVIQLHRAVRVRLIVRRLARNTRIFPGEKNQLRRSSIALLLIIGLRF